MSYSVTATAVALATVNAASSVCIGPATVAVRFPTQCPLSRVLA